MTVQGPRQSPPDSAAPNIKSSAVAQLRESPTHYAATLAARGWYRRWWDTSRCGTATAREVLHRLQAVRAYVAELERLADADQAAALLELKQSAGSWRALGKQLGVPEATLRGWAAQGSDLSGS